MHLSAPRHTIMQARFDPALQCIFLFLFHNLFFPFVAFGMGNNCNMEKCTGATMAPLSRGDRTCFTDHQCNANDLRFPHTFRTKIIIIFMRFLSSSIGGLTNVSIQMYVSFQGLKDQSRKLYKFLKCHERDNFETVSDNECWRNSGAIYIVFRFDIHTNPRIHHIFIYNHTHTLYIPVSGYPPFC